MSYCRKANRTISLIMVGGGGFEPPKLSRQIYSLIPLTARESRPLISHLKYYKKMELAIGLEPTTAGLQNRCSTN